MFKLNENLRTIIVLILQVTICKNEILCMKIVYIHNNS